MFEHHIFEKYPFLEIPEDQDLYAVSEDYMEEFENALIRRANDEPKDFKDRGIPVSVDFVEEDYIELAWYYNFYDRFHVLRIRLRRNDFVICVGCQAFDEIPHIFVKREWINELLLRTHALFGYIDAAGMKNAINTGRITRSKLIQIRDAIDVISSSHSNVLFMSFADSILMKSKWDISMRFEVAPGRSVYSPEELILIASDIQRAYIEILGLNTYAIFTQGTNEFHGDDLFYSSSKGNHISLNSFGTPFAQIFDIEAKAKRSIRENAHVPAEIYMDEDFFNTLNFQNHNVKMSYPSIAYETKMMSRFRYYRFGNIASLISEIRTT